MDVIEERSLCVGLAIEHVEREATLLFEQGKNEASNELLLQYVPGYSSSYFYFLIGRNYAYLDEFGSARTWLEKSLDADLPFSWSYYELGHLLFRQKKTKDAAEAFAKFLKTVDLSTMGMAHWEIIIKISHRLFEIDRRAAMIMYRAMGIAGVKDYLSQLRYAEDFLDRGLGNEAQNVIQQIQESFSLDIWGLFALSKAKALQGDNAAAIEQLVKVLENHSRDPFVIATTIHRAIDIKCFEQAEAILSKSEGYVNQSTSASKHILGAAFRLGVKREDFDRIDLLRNQHNGLASEIDNWIIVEAIFELTLPGDQITDRHIRITSDLVGQLEINSTSSLETILALYHFYSRRRMWERAFAHSEAVKTSSFKDHPETIIKHFDLLCLTTRLDEAERFYLDKLADRELGQWELCSVMRFWAERRKWEEAGKALEEFLSRGFIFPQGEFFILQICRKTKMHEKVLELVRAITTSKKDVSRLRRVVSDDLALREELDHDNNPNPVCSIQNRFLLKRTLLSGGVGNENIILFCCVDPPYFLSFLFLIASYAQNSFSITSRWMVFLDSAVPDRWVASASAFAAALGLFVVFIKESEFVNAEAIHVETYGVFTGGNTLSRAAYFRIYAARYIFRNCKVDRAIYLDSDIVCSANLEEFASQSFDGSLLQARSEEFSPEIRDAAVKNSLNPLNYFNSGVLQFDMREAETEARLVHALHLAENEGHRLVFHDQCALNIAFADRTKRLDKRFNFFVRPGRPNNGNLQDGVLIHFLDKPKPWDVSYDREYRSFWTAFAPAVSLGIQDAKVFREIVASANGH